MIDQFKKDEHYSWGKNDEVMGTLKAERLALTTAITPFAKEFLMNDWKDMKAPQRKHQLIPELATISPVIEPLAIVLKDDVEGRITMQTAKINAKTKATVNKK